MERNKKALVGLLLTSLLSFSVVPYFNLQAQSCNPNALTPVSYGQRGNAVRNAQLCLMEAGYDIPAGATGYYGSQTRNAVREFYADWYGSWSGNSLGPRGVAQLKSILAAGGSFEEETGGTKPSQQPSQQTSQQDQTSAIVAAVLAALQQLGVVPSTTNQQQSQTAEEGFLTVEKDPSVGVVTLREGETGKVVGIRFRADNGAVTVKSIFLRWNGNYAPHRVISALSVKDSSGNVLYQTNVGPSTFLQDSSLNYYLPVSGLNVQVPKNGYNSVFVEVTVVGTLPSSATLSFKVNQNDVRGVDGAGVDRFGPADQNGLTWNVNLQAAIAGSAYFVGARNINSPLEGYITADDDTAGTANQKLVYKFDLTAKNDNLRLTQITGSVSNTSTVSAVYLRQGNIVLDSQTPHNNGSFTFNLVPSNFTVNKDQTVTFDILVDLAGGSSTSEATFTVSVATTTGQNSLGDQKSTYVNLTSEVMHYVNVAPVFAVVSKQVNVTKDQGNNTTTVTNAEFKIDITAVGGDVYIPITGVATITLETHSTSTATTTGPSTVMQGSTPVNPSGGYYRIPEGSTYTFTFQTSGQPFTGVQSVRAKLSSIKWDSNGSAAGGEFTASFLDNNSNFWTGYVSP